MESSATKHQSIIEGTMATTQSSYFHTELELRRQRLLAATRAEAHDASLHQLLASVDDALSRLHAGTFGICESCQTVEQRTHQHVTVLIVRLQR